MSDQMSETPEIERSETTESRDQEQKLEDQTHAPESHIEQTQTFEQSEAIESTLVSVVNNSLATEDIQDTLQEISTETEDTRAPADSSEEVVRKRSGSTAAPDSPSVAEMDTITEPAELEPAVEIPAEEGTRKRPGTPSTVEEIPAGKIEKPVPADEIHSGIEDFQHVQVVIGRAMVDETFRKGLTENPEQTLAAYNLSAEERQVLQSMKSEVIDEAAQELTSSLMKGVEGKVYKFFKTDETGVTQLDEEIGKWKRFDDPSQKIDREGEFDEAARWTGPEEPFAAEPEAKLDRAGADAGDPAIKFFNEAAMKIPRAAESGGTARWTGPEEPFAAEPEAKLDRKGADAGDPAIKFFNEAAMKIPRAAESGGTAKWTGPEEPLAAEPGAKLDGPGADAGDPVFKFFNDPSIKWFNDPELKLGSESGKISANPATAVLGRAISDPDFRQQLLENPEETLAPYNLNTQETAALKSINAKILKNITEKLAKATGREYPGLMDSKWP